MSDGEGDEGEQEPKKDYYAILGIARSASSAEIKKAYRNLALRLHPDHNKSATATEEFQELAKIHSVLSDPKKKAFYDKHGEPGDDVSEADMDAYEYWRTIFPAFSEKDIEEYRKTYVGATAEKEDLLARYEQHEGDMRSIMESVPFADSENFDRLVAILEDSIPKSDPFRKVWVKSCKGLKKKLQKEEGSEAKEAEEMKKDLNLGKDFDAPAGADGIPSGLAALISSRQKAREQNFFDNLAAKYASPAKKEKKNGDATKRKK